MKRFFILFLINCCFLVGCNSQSYLDEGTFISVSNIANDNYTINNSHLYKNIDGETLTLLYQMQNYDFGSFSVDGISPGFVIDKKNQGNKLLLKWVLDFPVSGVRTYNNDYNEYNLITITIIDNDEIIFDDLISYADEKNNHYYRISGPAKIPIKNAVINDNRVRLRVKPNLTCDTWALLDKDLPVKIKDKSKEKSEINGEKWYWYKVDHPDYPDGWVYGKYLDIEK